MFVRKGRLTLNIPELERKSLAAGTWCMLRDHGPVTSITEDDTEGVVLEADIRNLEILAQSDSVSESMLECLSCPDRGTAFFAKGPIRGTMLRGLTRLNNEPRGLAICQYCERQAAAFELLGQILEQVQRQRRQECRPCYTKADREKFDEIARFLEDNLSANHSLTDLSRRFYLNEFKLKQGFKAFHGRTVFAYLREARMQRAESLLTKGDKTVVAVSHEMGYSNPSHFARAFRAHHGHNPGEITLKKTAPASDD
jgi:AraC-like DNA-binding protein